MEQLERLSKANCGEQISLETLRNNQLEMLKTLVSFCEQHGIRYYLSGGTLLGAVRHQGFIPWDDDIDINMPRPDCEKLQELTQGKLGSYRLQRPDASCPYHSESWRVYDPSVVIESSIGGTSKKAVYMPAFIDIFPIEGLPDSIEETKKQYQKLQLNRKFINCTTGSAWHGKTLSARVFHLVVRPFAKLIGYKTFYNNIQKTVVKYAFDDSTYVGVMTAWVHTLEERVLKSEYVPQVKVTFEGMQLNAPKNYDTYLTQLYGKNYMELPPVEKRMSHHGFQVYRYKRG